MMGGGVPWLMGRPDILQSWLFGGNVPRADSQFHQPWSDDAYDRQVVPVVKL